MSKPQAIETRQDDLFRTRLNPKHPLFMLTHMIDWSSLEDYFSCLYQSELGHPPLPIRLMVGLMMLQHMEALSDEQVVRKWVENPYYQYFCVYDYFQWKLPLDPSSLTRWRQRIGQEGVEKILAATIQTSRACGHSSQLIASFKFSLK
ncbi:MAG: transposase [Candidatus Paracaedibacteraceae bacterium]|nr:transposase [Candidatus Paracaedibacteraceae bacterium]